MGDLPAWVDECWYRQRVDLREKLLQAQNDSKAAFLRHHSRSGSIGDPKLGIMLSEFARQQDEHLRGFDRATVRALQAALGDSEP